MNLCTSLTSKLKLNFLFCFFICSFISATALAQSDSSTHLVVKDIVIIGNKKTRPKIILRELTVYKNEAITFDQLAYIKKRSEQNLINTSLFNFVTITDTIDWKSHDVTLFIDVKERWYIWPQLIFEIQDRNFNQWWLTKDLFRINYGAALNVENFTGNKDVLSFIVRLGYSERFGISYKIPYINKSQTVGIGASYLLNRNNEINYKTESNKLLFFRSYRFHVREETEAKIGLTIRKNLYQKHIVELEYNTAKVKDTIQEINPDYFNKKLGNIRYFSFQYRYILDLRDNKPYPLKGWLAEITAVKDGLGILKDEVVDNVYSIWSLKYFTPLHRRFYLGSSIKYRATSIDSKSYYFNKALGYNDDFVRGYEYYVIDGQNYALGKMAIKYQLVKPRIIDLSRLRHLNKFNRIPYAIYLSAFTDGAKVNEKFFSNTNYLNNTFIYGYGLGLDIVTYYDNVIRLEYSINKQLEHGFFLHFTAGL